MSNRFMTDGAGQEVCAQMEKVIARFNGTTPPEVTPGTYDSKDFLSEETGRALAGKVSDLADAVGTFIENNGNDISDAVVTLGASLTFNGSAQTQTVASVKLGSVTLRAGTDYEISGNVATNAGNYTLIVSGKGDYSGFVFVDWSIAKAQGSISAPSSVNIVGLVGSTHRLDVSISTGYGTIAAVSSSPAVAKVLVDGSAIMVELVSTGATTITLSLVGNYTASDQITVNVTVPSSTLANNTPELIRLVADADMGESLWAVGDTYPVTINGTVGEKTYNNVTLWAYIIGFNHNSSLEGEHLIHFGGFKTAKTNGVDVALDDSKYQTIVETGEKVFNIFHTDQGLYIKGWAFSDMRYDILGSTDAKGGEPTDSCATSPVANTLLSAFPTSLREVMRPARKYTHNGTDSRFPVDSPDRVFGMSDFLPLLAEYELMGVQKYANSTEQNYQQQYDYYKNGNSKIKYKQSATGNKCLYWLRSIKPSTYPGLSWVYFSSSSSSVGSGSSCFSNGVAPIFFI